MTRDMPDDSQVISLVMVSDNAGAMPLTVAAYSAIDNLKDLPVNLFILDGGISPSSKRKFCQSIPADRVKVHWLYPADPRLEVLCKKGDYRRFPVPTLYRLLVARILPQAIRKVIYLDSDIIVLHDLAKLWSIDTGNYHFLAVQEPDGPYVIDCFHKFNPQLKVDFEKYGVSREHKYCNAGVMLIDLEKWRHDEIMEKALCFLESNPARCLDQDALNVILAGRWGTLDPRWNQTRSFHRKQENNPYSAEVIDQVVRDPFIIHFTGPQKPWATAASKSSHPQEDLWLRYSMRTAWARSIRRNSWLHRPRALLRALLNHYSRS
jgi:lipopolysaccharide biosynthesis glycosyltransferase